MIGNTVLILIYLIFLFPSAAAFKRKLPLLAATAQGRAKVQAVVGSIRTSIQGYLMVQTLMSAIISIASYLTLVAIGLPYPNFWALLIFGPELYSHHWLDRRRAGADFIRARAIQRLGTRRGGRAWTARLAIRDRHVPAAARDRRVDESLHTGRRFIPGDLGHAVGRSGRIPGGAADRACDDRARAISRYTWLAALLSANGRPLGRHRPENGPAHS
ncbi:MAG: hypothetical protein WDN76_03090 [Alphaproteobacteria bacterium]